MTPTRKRRLYMILIIVVGVSIAASLTLAALNRNMEFFYDPSQVAAGEAPRDRLIRVGGMVVDGSIVRASDSLLTQFDVTDNVHSMTIAYTGILPDLFREGQGIIAKGKMDENGHFIAAEVLAKHDETYMPPEVASAMKNKASQP